MKRYIVSTMILVLAGINAQAQWTNGQNAQYVIGQANFTSSAAGTGMTNFNASQNVAIDYTHNKIYVNDRHNFRVLRYSYPVTSNNPTAEIIFGNGFADNGDPTKFQGVNGLAVYNGALWVCDGGNSRILKFDNAYSVSSNFPGTSVVLGQTGVYLNKTGSAANQLKFPDGIYIDAIGNLWVADLVNNRILEYLNVDSKATNASADLVLGQSAFGLSGTGSTTSTMNQPSDVYVAGSGTSTIVWVADAANDRILRFDNPIVNGVAASGVLSGSNPDFPTQSSFWFNSQLGHITGDNAGKLYVVDISNSRILIYNDAVNKSNGANADNVLGVGNFTSHSYHPLSQSAFGNGGPYGLTFDNTSNRLYVSDNEYNRVMIFQESYTGTVTTQAVTNSSSSTATGNGSVTVLGNTNPTDHGVCWNTTGAPTTTDSHTAQGALSSTGAFTSSITGLTVDTKYYVRAYVTNAAGTSYGNEVTFISYNGMGSGTSGDPYLVGSLTQLTAISSDTAYWNQNFKQTSDIVASSISDWSPIGNSTTPFTGSYDGSGHAISSLTISSGNTVGFFGIISGATVCNLGLTAISINDGSSFHAGGIAAVAQNSSQILNCYVTGSISSGGYCGGIVGDNTSSTIRNCYSRASVASNDRAVGGIAGTNDGTIGNSYSSGSVSGGSPNGALIGSNSGTMTNLFWDNLTCTLTSSAGQGTMTGGIGVSTTLMKTQSTFTDAGWDFITETANGTNDYWRSNGTDNDGYPLLSGQNFTATVTTQNVTNIATNTATGNCTITQMGKPSPTKHGVCWNTTGTPTIADNCAEDGVVVAVGAFTARMTKLTANTVYYVRAYVANDAGTSYGDQVSFVTYPGSGIGTSSHPFLVSSMACLTWIDQHSDYWGKYYLQTATINASSTSTSDGGSGWLPLGSSSTKFSGTYNGQGYTIDSLYINRSTTNGVGFFGYTLGGTIKGLGLTSVNISGQSYTGGLVGYNDNTPLTNCSVTGTVKGTGVTGGLTGEIDNSTVSRCFSTATVTSSGTYFAGLAAKLSNATVYNCYATGNVTAILMTYTYGAGLVAYSDNSTIDKCYATGLIIGNPSYTSALVVWATYPATNSFWDKTTSGRTSTSLYGGEGKTTAEMKTMSTFTATGWDVTGTVWKIDATNTINKGYPFLAWQNTGGSALPVELVSFTSTVNTRSVELLWHTATEMNNLGFDIERQSAGSWSKVGFVEGHGTTNAPQSYSYSDKPGAGKYLYRLKQIDRDGKFEYSQTIEANVVLPVQFGLLQNFPNPFNPTTVINYSIASASHVSLKVYDLLGREIAVLVNGQMQPGNYTASFDGSRLSSGVYFYRLEAGSFSDVKKLSVMK